MTANPGTADPGDRLAGEARYRRFLDALLVGDVAYCRAEVQAWLDTGRGVRALYEDLIQRALYDVGMLWESGRASVADEHLATAISESLLNLSYPYLFDRPSTGCSALVTCAANEYHQIGARMVADIFELHGWRSYLCRRHHDAAQIAAADQHPKKKMALIFRWYFGHANRLALQGDADHKVDFQIHCGPALGGFNQWVKGTPLENWRRRHFDEIGLKLMDDTARLLMRRFGALFEQDAAPPIERRVANCVE